MIYVYFFIKSVGKSSGNSVRFEFFMDIAFQMGQFFEILSHSVKYGMYFRRALHCTELFISFHCLDMTLIMLKGF